MDKEEKEEEMKLGGGRVRGGRKEGEGGSG